MNRLTQYNSEWDDIIDELKDLYEMMETPRGRLAVLRSLKNITKARGQIEVVNRFLSGKMSEKEFVNLIWDAEARGENVKD